MISLAMIVKNEQNRIARAIGSVRDCVGEVIVVDTGSTDGTRRKAEELGATVLDYPFRGDFSAARNVSIEVCRGDWILCLDADEFFLFSPQAMLEAATDKTICDEPNAYKGYYLLRQNHEHSGQELSYSDYVLRLFRNRPGVHFTHHVHETLEESLDSMDGKYGRLTAMPIVHYLFERDAAYLEGKHQAYVEGLLKDIGQRPADASRYDFLGCEYLRLGLLTEAESAFRKLLELDPGNAAGRESLETVVRLKQEFSGKN